MTTHFHHMPVDRTAIKTRLRIHPDLFDDPNAYIRKRGIQVRTSKPSRGKSKLGPTRNLTLDVLNYKGIQLKLSQVTGDPLTNATIDFNPCRCLYNHNGFVLRLREFLHALALLVTHLQPLLHDPADWIDLLPGLRCGGVASWDSVEVHFQYDDSAGGLFAAFRQAVPDKPNIPVRHWLTSIHIGGHNSDRLLRIYIKGPEMVEHGKLDPERLADYEHVLRLEARLKGKKLIAYLGNERNVEVIDGVERLVRFYPADLPDGLCQNFGVLQGVYPPDEPAVEAKPKETSAPLGKLLARVALDPRSPLTFLELVEHLRFYTGADSDTISPIKKAGVGELSRLSPVSKDELFSDAIFGSPLHVASEQQEVKVLHELEDAFAHPLIYKAYQPPDQPFQPMTKLPTYLRAERQ